MPFGIVRSEDGREVTIKCLHLGCGKQVIVDATGSLDGFRFEHDHLGTGPYEVFEGRDYE